MYKKTLLTLIIIAAPLMMVAADFTSRIEIQKGEKWWGVFINNSPSEPFLKPFNTQTNQYSADGSFTVPMLVSSDGRYLWSSQPLKIEFSQEIITVTSRTENVTVKKGGKNLREAYLVCCHKNFAPAGKMPPMEMFLRPFYETRTEFGFVHSQRSLTEYADRIIAEGLPKGTIVISEGWRSLGGSYDFDREYYPDPRRMIDDLHAKGFKVMLVLTPLITASGRTYMSYADNSFLVRRSNGSPLIVENDGGFNACVDLGMPQSAAMIREKLDNLMQDYKVDGFRFDARAVLPFIDKSAGRDKFMKNWLLLGTGVPLCEFLPGSEEPLSATVNCIRNNDSSGWGAIKESVTDIISAGLSGFPYCHIVPGKASTKELFGDSELMARTLQIAAFMPLVSIDFAPWRIENPKLYQQVKQTLAMRESIQAYIRESVEESSRTAEPLVRHMEYQFPRNGFSDCDDQFMLGSKYLIVVPADGESKRIVRLPRGLWADASGRRFKGPLVVNVDVSDGRMVWFESTSK